MHEIPVPGHETDKRPGTGVEDVKEFRRLVEDAPDIIMVLEADLTVRYVSRSITELLGYRRENVIGNKVDRYFHPKDKLRARKDFVAKHATSEDLSTLMDLRMWHADGSWLHFEVAFNDLLDDPSVRGFTAYFHDMTKEKLVRSALVHRAFHDSITGLPNRTLFMDRLDLALARATRQRGAVTVLFVDLDDFKAVNDSLGHEAGDRLLAAVGRLLAKCVRPEDTVARLGGDEFAILLEVPTDPIDAIRIVERTMQALQAPIVFEGHRRLIKASIGVAHAGSGRERAEDLLWRADLAMYSAKKKGKARFELFEKDMSEVARYQFKLEHDLSRAFDLGQLRIHYQPEVMLEDGKIIGMEALLRWQNPEHDSISPKEFVRLAEASGSIISVGRWILEESCRQALLWHERYPEAAPLVSVNLSAKQLRQPTLFREVDAALRKTGLHPSYLMLEIAEGFSIDEAPHVVDTVRKLKDLGVKLALDDFGVGSSSFSYLQRLPVDVLKIDRTLVEKLGHNGNGTRKLVSAMIGFARAMNIRTVAEGVETAEQSDELSEMGCELAQGFYFWEPLAGPEATDLLESNQES